MEQEGQNKKKPVSSSFGKKALGVVFRVGIICLFAFLGTKMKNRYFNSDKQPEPKVLGKAISAPYEMLLVADKQWLETAAGQYLLSELNKPIEGLPQEEQHFRITKIDPINFKGTFLYYANVLMVDIDKKYDVTHVLFSSDWHCKPQKVVKIEAPNDSAILNKIHDDGQMILEAFDDHEITREKNYLDKHYSTKFYKAAQNQFGIKMKVPEDISDIKTGKNFIWGSSIKQEFRTNVCVYTVKMKNNNVMLKDLTMQDFVEMRDSVMKINIPGGREDQWMETDSRTVTRKHRITNQGRTNTLIFRGLWDMKNDAMGGPFISYVIADYPKNQFIVSEGFIFAPEEKKREMIRQLEAAVDVEIPSNQ